ncbi:MAG TPA: response regulator [Phenylobacterium sp.]
MISTARSNAAGATVLIVEDEPEICALLTDTMEAEGFQTKCVPSDSEAYVAIQHNAAYACMIVDVNLGTGTTGYDVARFARQIDAALPVIYVSGQTSPESFMKNGVPGSLFVEKPFSPAELMEQVHKLVGDNDG